jgi:hypothetical protein
MIKVLFTFVVIVFAIFSCSPVRQVVPLKEKESAVSLAFGGPLIRFSGLVIPVPLTSVDYAYGINNTSTISGSLHTTSMLFGVYHIEGGFLKQVWSRESKAGITLRPAFHFMVDQWEWQPSFYPYLDVNYYRYYGKKENMLYGSVSFLFDTRQYKDFDVQNKNRFVPTLSLGHVFTGDKLHWSLELKYINFTRSNENIVVEYISPASTGSLGFYVGVKKMF